MLDYLGTSYSNIKTIWGCFEAIMGNLGAIRGPSWEVLSALRASWGLIVNFRGPPAVILKHLWVRLAALGTQSALVDACGNPPTYFELFLGPALPLKRSVGLYRNI